MAGAGSGNHEEKPEGLAALVRSIRAWAGELGFQHTGIAALDLLVPPAHAQAEPNIDVSSPEIAHIKAQMENRFGELKPHLDSGAIGLTNDGYLAAREVPLALRNTVRTLVANENADRVTLYREIATANKHPEWEASIRKVFAQRWIVKAPAGWCCGSTGHCATCPSGCCTTAGSTWLSATSL
jgi:uncharacterized protein YdbL (DUF1318 family)